MTVLILGATSMIGSEMMSYFKNSGIKAIGTSRRSNSSEREIVNFDAQRDDLSDLFETLPKLKAVVNNIGIIKSHINHQNADSVLNAIEINSIFPNTLSNFLHGIDVPLIQIGTDCVYSGTEGSYDENSNHDAWDTYGKTKSLGEPTSPNTTILRCSVVGKEKGRSTNLLEWVLSQPQNAVIQGFENHHWNGITTHAFSKICAGIIRTARFKPGTHHVVPTGTVTKKQLVEEIAIKFGRSDISVQSTDAKETVNRTLSTVNESNNREFWTDAGYSSIPTVSEMIDEYIGFIGEF